MYSGASRTGRVSSLVLALAFLFATGPDVFGLQDCPYHGHASVGDEAAESGEGHDHGSAAEGPGSPAGEGPCTWLVDCHASLESSPHVPVGKTHLSALVPDRAARLIDAHPRPWGPRHQLFELHLPNAPPSHG